MSWLPLPAGEKKGEDPEGWAWEPPTSCTRLYSSFQGMNVFPVCSVLSAVSAFPVSYALSLKAELRGFASPLSR